jgi:hypothetical protein
MNLGVLYSVRDTCACFAQQTVSRPVWPPLYSVSTPEASALLDAIAAPKEIQMLVVRRKRYTDRNYGLSPVSRVRLAA